MSTVQEVKPAITKLSPQEAREVAEWLENFLEDLLEVRPEFLERLELARRQLSNGECRTVQP